ncbi:MAG: hypothetical protein ACSW8D_01090 [Prevotella sp.]
MTNKETIDRWAELIIPAVFKAEDALQKAVPEWKERLKHLNEAGGEDSHKVAAEYCREIATIIVTRAADYEPDGTIPYDNNPCNVELPDEEKTDLAD